MKCDVQQLMQAEQAAKEKEAALASTTTTESEVLPTYTREIEFDDTSREIAKSSLSAVTDSRTETNNAPTDLESNKTIGSVDTSQDSQQTRADVELLSCLTKFADATSQLYVEIEKAISQ